MTQVQPDFFNNFTSGRSVGFQTTAARVQLSSLSLTLARLNKQAFDMDRKIAGLQARGKELNVKGAHEAEAIAESEELAARADKRARALEKTAARKAAAPPTSAKATAIAAKIAVFSTYAPFPYEEEQQRVLGWFTK